MKNVDKECGRDRMRKCEIKEQRGEEHK